MTSRPPVELCHLCGDSAVAFGYALDITGTTVGRMAAIDKLIAQAKQMLTERVA
jgi:hypothetical protein